MIGDRRGGGNILEYPSGGRQLTPFRDRIKTLSPRSRGEKATEDWKEIEREVGECR